MTHSGHEIVKCECGNVLRQCRCIGNKPEFLKSPCECEKPLHTESPSTQHDEEQELTRASSAIVNYARSLEGLSDLEMSQSVQEFASAAIELMYATHDAVFTKRFLRSALKEIQEIKPKTGTRVN